MEILSNGTDKVQAQIQDYKEYHTDVTVRFVIHMAPVSSQTVQTFYTVKENYF